MAITLRSDKGSALTIKELDDNFRHFTGSHAVTGSLVVSGSLVISGSISATSGISATGSLITASAVDNTITFTKGDGSNFDITVATGSGGGGGGSIDTGSFYVSSSILDSTITFTQGDGTTESLVVPTGSASSIDTGSFAVTSSNHFTGSQFFSGSLIPEATGINNGIYDLGSQTNPWRDLYLTTASLKFITDGEVVSVMTGEPNAIRVGNVLITTASLAFVNNDGDVISTVAEVSYSGSTPVSASFTDTGSLIVSGSVDGNTIDLIYGSGDVISLTVDTGSLPSGVISGSSQLPSGIVSGSTQLEDLGAILSSGGDTSITGSLIVSGGDFITSGLTFPSTDGTLNQVIATDGSGNLTFIGMETGSIPAGTVSGSQQIEGLGFITSSTSGTISGSQQIEDLGFLTSSASGILSGSQQLEGLGFITSSSPGTVSGSQQIEDLGFLTSSNSGIVSGSTQLESLGFLTSSNSGILSGSTQLESLGFITSSSPGTVSGSQQVLDFVTASDLDMDGNRVLFANVYNTEADLPSATTYHGMFAHVHATGKGYFAHSGNWIKLIDESSSNTGDLLEGTNLYYTDERVKTKLDAESIISSSQQIESLGFISSSGGVTSFSGSTSFTGSTEVSGSLTVIDNQGFRVEGNTVLTGSNLFQGVTIVTGDSFSVNTTSSFGGDVDITGSLTVTEGITGSLQGTSSVSLDSLLLEGKDSATFATTGSNDFKASQYITGSVVIAPSADPGTSNINATYLFTSASNFSADQCDFYYRNKGTLWDQEWIEYGVGSGLIYGGVVTFSGTDLYVSPGGGIVVNYNAETGSANAVVPTQVKWGAITASATYLTSSQYSHLYIDENGDLQQQVEDFTTQQYLEKIPLGTLGHLTNTYIDAFGEEKQTTYAGPAQANQFIRAFGPLKQQGYDLSASGSSLGFNTSTGITFKLGGFYSKDPNNPSVYDTPSLSTTDATVRVYRSGSDFVGDINSGNFYNTIDPTKYDDGTGTLVNISGSTTTIQRVFVGPTSERFYVYYGQKTYDSLATAVSQLATEQFVESLTTSKSLTFVGYLVVRADATDLSNTSQANLINSGLFRNTVGGSGGATSTISNLGEITDVDINAPSTRQYLEYDAGIWRNRTIEYGDIDSSGASIISSSAQLESLGVSVASGSSTTFSNNVVISGSSSNLEVQGDLHVTGSLSTKTQVANPSFTPLGWALTIPVSTGNFFETNLQPSVNTIGFGLTGGYTGQTINLKVIQSSPNPGTITWGSNVEFADGFDSAASTGAGDIDVWSFVTFDGTTWYATGLKNFS